MERYYIDTRVHLSLKVALDEDIELGNFTGRFLALASSVSSKIESTSSPFLTSEEYHFLRDYMRDLVVTESRSRSYEHPLEPHRERIARQDVQLRTGEQISREAKTMIEEKVDWGD